ncbi:nucleotidyltransferase family protein [Clostridium tarantellae]|uniref:Nucleotidyltransferase n=1 Tax=Clostridium tarantellae TaxID=39493 RepID=A0A6I1MKV4_9CLOT|nr:sugar phosphate nucleotidyltransferase [Clostridium tarantellae]MPQ44146.1 nucleotidyltransferase [Clostridium tarantellae]
MVKPTLIVMAAGMGSRYGSLKQIDPIGPNGEIIIEYSIHDAIKAGFGKVVFIIKKELLKSFKEIVESKIDNVIEVEYVFQEIDKIPKGFNIPKDRVKPWGTGHAILCCKDIINTPFAVINADDFYGQSTFKIIGDYLINNKNPYQYAMAGFVLENTLTEFGTVARGICNVDKNEYLISVEERTQIKKIKNITKYLNENNEWITIEKGSIASMNIWAFTPTIFNELEKEFKFFLKGLDNKEKSLQDEFYIPFVIDKLLKENKITVKVLKSVEQWYGVTYKEDKGYTREAINKLMGKTYPNKLWEANFLNG